MCVCLTLFCLVLTLSKREDFPVVHINNFREKESLRQDFSPRNQGTGKWPDWLMTFKS